MGNVEGGKAVWGWLGDGKGAWTAHPWCKLQKESASYLWCWRWIQPVPLVLPPFQWGPASPLASESAEGCLELPSFQRDHFRSLDALYPSPASIDEGKKKIVVHLPAGTFLTRWGTESRNICLQQACSEFPINTRFHENRTKEDERKARHVPTFKWAPRPHFFPSRVG